jgi:hypothetical protein
VKEARSNESKFYKQKQHNIRYAVQPQYGIRDLDNELRAYFGKSAGRGYRAIIYACGGNIQHFEFDTLAEAENCAYKYLEKDGYKPLPEKLEILL